jgi:hypothetical protein
MLTYEYDQQVIQIEEQTNGDDVELWIRLQEANAEVEKAVKKIRDEFDQNDVLTDVLFYAHTDGYQWVVRNDFYVDFILQLFKYRLVRELRWKQ